LFFVGFLKISLKTVYPTIGIDGKRYKRIGKDGKRYKKMGKDGGCIRERRFSCDVAMGRVVS